MSMTTRTGDKRLLGLCRFSVPLLLKPRVRFLPPQEFYGMNKAKSLNFVQGLRYPVVCDRLGYFDSEVFTRRWIPLPDHDGQGGQVAWELMRNITAESRERQQRRSEADALGIPQGVPLDDARMEFYRGV